MGRPFLLRGDVKLQPFQRHLPDAFRITEKANKPGLDGESPDRNHRLFVPVPCEAQSEVIACRSHYREKRNPQTAQLDIALIAPAQRRDNVVAGNGFKAGYEYRDRGTKPCEYTARYPQGNPNPTRESHRPEVLANQLPL
jgi:hypothetical protein